MDLAEIQFKSAHLGTVVLPASNPRRLRESRLFNTEES
jgi:hypothetical protein